MWKLLLAGLLLTTQVARTQEKVQADSLYPAYKSAVNFSPLALVQLDLTFLAGVEYRYTPKLSLTVDGGYIFGSAMYSNETGRVQGKGFIIRPGVRLYTSAKGGYLQAQLFYKQVTHLLHDWLEKEVVNNVPSYEQQQDFRYRRTAAGLNVLAGRHLKLGNKIFADLYIGAGLRYKTWSVVGEPDSRYQNTGAVVIDDGSGESPSVLPSIPAGVRLVFIL